MRILVHTCCGPCGTYVLDALIRGGATPHAYYYNPNIASAEEHDRRLFALAKLTSALRVATTVEAYAPDDYRQIVSHSLLPPERCRRCYLLRLRRTAILARDNRFDAFTTTLLISPYQHHELLKETCETLASEIGIAFLYEDYRTGYRASRQMARDLGLYMQPYCGCVHSLAEREAQRALKTKTASPPRGATGASSGI